MRFECFLKTLLVWTAAVVFPVAALAQELELPPLQIPSSTEVASSPPSSTPPMASTTVCAPGRVAGPETAGRCCWPGQRWSESRARCEGPPQCPQGFAAEGDECVAIVAAGPVRPAMTVTPFAPWSTLPPPPVPLALPPGPPPPRYPQYRRQPYRGGPIPSGALLRQNPHPYLLGIGETALALGYAAAVVASLSALYGTPCEERTVPWNLVPIVGPLLAIVAFETNRTAGPCSYVTASYAQSFVESHIVIAVFQIGGALTFAAAHLFPERWLLVPLDTPSQQHRVSWSLFPGAHGSEAGLTLLANF